MSYKNLKAEMVKHGITQIDAADLLGMTSNNFSMKVREKVPFTIEEMKLIRDTFFPEANLEYLCESDNDTPSTSGQPHTYADMYEAETA